MKCKLYGIQFLCMMVCLSLLLGMNRGVGAQDIAVDTESSLPATNLPPVMATSATQDKNIIWYVRMASRDAQQMVTFTASYNQAYLCIREGMRTSDQLATNGTMYTSVAINSTNSVLKNIYYTYVGKSVGGGTSVGGTNIGNPYYKARYNDILLECRFDSYYDFDPLHFSIISSNSSSYVLSWAVLGDVNEDGAIDSADAQLALNHSVGVTLSELQQRAADVNEDGVIDASDALLINQYSAGTISSFWKSYSVPSSLPTTATSSIKSNATYCFQNAYNANGLAPLSSSPTSGELLKQTTFNTSSDSQQCVIVYMGSGEYEIRSKQNSSLVWAKSTGNELILQTRSSGSASQRWYIIPYNDGTYTLINKAATTKCLTTAGDSNNDEIKAHSVAISTSTTGHRWRIYRDVGRTSKDYYDASFALRYQRYGNNSSGVIYNSHPARLIGDIHTEATQIFGSLLGVSIAYEGMVPYQSLADACRNNRELSETSISRCVSFGSGHVHGKADGITLHCTDQKAHDQAFTDAYASTGESKIATLWSGAYLYKEGSTTAQNRSWTRSGEIHMVNRYNSGMQAVDMTAVYVHEMAHRWGAWDHYHEEVNGVCDAGLRGVCSDPSCPTFEKLQSENKVHRPAKCMMNNHMIGAGESSYQKLFCSYCLADMKQTVKNKY